jgi:hypothetical protein
MSDKTARPTFALRIEALPDTDPIRSLRWLLKTLLRQCGFRCVSISQESARLLPPPAARDIHGGMTKDRRQ